MYARKTPPLPNLRDIDLKLLRVFAAVVRHRGFAAAQDELGISASTISIHIRQLEERLDTRLCERGRSGFHLTEQGRIIYDAALHLFRSLETFRGIVGSMKGQLTGEIYFGVVDAVATNSSIRMERVISDFSDLAPEVTLHIDISSPQALHQGLLEERYHVILSPMLRMHDALNYTQAFSETQLLFCGNQHDLFNAPADGITRDAIAASVFAGRSYVLESNPPTDIDFRVRTTASHMESIALFVLSGKYIGYLPDHYADQWVRNNQMRALLPSVYRYQDKLYLRHRARETNRSAKAFIQCAALLGNPLRRRG